MKRLVRASILLMIGCAGAALAVPIPASRAASANAPVAQDAAHGQQLYMQDGCYQCHGTVGQGGSGTGPRLAPNPMAFDRFQRQVWDPVDLMPRYPQEYVSAQDVADIYAYLQSIEAGPRPEDVPLLNQ
jgi:mono/diheme cytochrome c family protein